MFVLAYVHNPERIVSFYLLIGILSLNVYFFLQEEQEQEGRTQESVRF